MEKWRSDVTCEAAARPVGNFEPDRRAAVVHVKAAFRLRSSRTRHSLFWRKTISQTRRQAESIHHISTAAVSAPHTLVRNVSFVSGATFSHNA